MPLVIHPRVRKGLRRAAALAAFSCFAAPGLAQAACPTTATAKVFQAFGDSADYVPVLNGGLEAGAFGWKLSNSSVVAGNEPFYVGAKTDARSLRIAPGGSAATPPLCVDEKRPTFRFFARQPGGAGAGSLKVSVRYFSNDRVVKEQALDTLTGANYVEWNPSHAVELFAKLGFMNGKGTTVARLVFTHGGQAGSPWLIDDVYVNPYRAG